MGRCIKCLGDNLGLGEFEDALQFTTRILEIKQFPYWFSVLETKQFPFQTLSRSFVRLWLSYAAMKN